MGQTEGFDGSKLALFLGRKLVVILRDERPDLPFAGHWDLPGGGREGSETPLQCAQRECLEELGLRVPDVAVRWRRRYQDRAGAKWFFVAKMPAATAGQIRFGDEGQRWTLMSAQAFVRHPKAVPAFQARLSDYLGEVGGVRAP